MAKRIIEARVKQKKDTLANWMANPLILLDGEQAFVLNANGREVNYKIGDGTKRFSELEFMIQYDQAAFSRITSNFLPISDGQTHYSLVPSGVYTQDSGGSITVPDGYFGIISNNGTTWYLDNLVYSKGEQGDKGDKGDEGEQGAQGQKGDKGDGVQLSGSVENYSDLANISPTPQIGDSYVVNSDGLIYTYGGNGFPLEGEGIEFITKSVYTRTDW